MFSFSNPINPGISKSCKGKCQKKIHAKKKVKKKFMQMEGPIVTFSHVVKKIRAEGFT